MARALDEMGGERAGVEATVCARDLEIHVDLFVEESGSAQAAVARGRASESVCGGPVRRGRAADRGNRARTVPGGRPDARDGRVVHGRARECEAHLGTRRQRGVRRRRGSVFERGEAASPGCAGEILSEYGAVSAETAAAMASRRARGSGCRCSARGHRGRGPEWGDAGKAGRTRLPARRGPGPGCCASARASRGPGSNPDTVGRERPAPSCGDSWHSRTHIRALSPTSVVGDERVRLFCALPLPTDVVETVVRWQEEELSGAAGARLVGPANLHVTLAFLGSTPADRVDEVVGSLSEAARGVEERIVLRVREYRETRSVGMLALEDEGGRAADLAGGLQSPPRGSRPVSAGETPLACSSHCASLPGSTPAGSLFRPTSAGSVRPKRLSIIQCCGLAERSTSRSNRLS